MKPPIPESEREEMLALARLPTQSMPDPSRVPMFRAVANLKGRITAEKKFPSTEWPPANGTAWEVIRNTLDQAMINRDFDAFDAFVEAWQKTGGASEVIKITISGGVLPAPVHTSAFGPPNHDPRSASAVDVLDAIQRLPRTNNGRAPYRKEIMKRLNERYKKEWHKSGRTKALKELTHRTLSKIIDSFGLKDRIGTQRN